MREKLSPELRRANTGGDDRVEVLVELRGSSAELEAIGFEPRSSLENQVEGYRILTGTIPRGSLSQLAALSQVVQVEGPRKMGPHLNYSLAEIRAVGLHRGSPPRKGSGVIIGVIDSGLDWRHGAFVNPDGTSRILALWDQLLDPAEGETPGPGGIGVVYEQDDISAALVGGATISARDRGGHGTHVAGIALGNGRPASCCHGSETYVGVAPEAELVFVHYDYEHHVELGANVRMVEALNFIIDRATNAQPHPRPVVINISQGDNMGPHDGTTCVDRAIDAALAGHTGRAVVVSAGNHANERSHVRGAVPGNDQVEIEFSTRDGFEGDAYLDLWYRRAGRLNIELTAVGWEPSGSVSHGTDHTYTVNPDDPDARQVEVEIDATINAPLDRDNNFRIKLTEPDQGSIPAQDCTLILRNPDPAPVVFHCWIERGEKNPRFLPSEPEDDDRIRADSFSTLSTPGTARGAITVANYASKTSCCDRSPSGDIRASSGRGPVARNAGSNPKPNIAAPGLDITAPKANPVNAETWCCSCCPDACCCLYTDKSGTSMSAPHVAGAIALMLEKNPTLTRDQIFDALRSSATPPPDDDPDAWGVGKLNAEGAVNAVPAPSGGGGGGVPHMRFEEHRAEDLDPREPLGVPPPLRIVQARLGALPEGARLAALVSRHFSEVRRLVNHNRRVATLWHRGRGPRMLRRLIHGAVDPEVPAPAGNADDEAYLRRWSQLLSRHGSPKLRANLAAHRETFFEMLRTPLAARVADLGPKST